MAGEYADELASLSAAPNAQSEADMLLDEFADHLDIISSTSPLYALCTYNCRWFARRVVVSFAQRLGNLIDLESYVATWSGNPVSYNELRSGLMTDPFGGKTLEGKRGAWIQVQTLIRLINGYTSLPSTPRIMSQVLKLSDEALEYFGSMKVVTSTQHAGLSACWAARAQVLRKMGDHAQGLWAARCACESARAAARGTDAHDEELVNRLDDLAFALDQTSARIEALVVRREAVIKRRRLISDENSSHHYLTLARTLQSIAGQLSVQGDDHAALSTTKEAVDAQLLALASSASSLASRDERLAIYIADHAQVLFRLGRTSNAITAISESVTILSNAVDHLAANPPRFEFEESMDGLRRLYAEQLLLQAMYAASIARWDDACTAGHMRVELLRMMAETDPSGSRSRSLIIGSNTLIRLLMDAKRPVEAYDVGLATLPAIRRLAEMGETGPAFQDDVEETEENLLGSLRALKEMGLIGVADGITQ